MSMAKLAWAESPEGVLRPAVCTADPPVVMQGSPVRVRVASPSAGARFFAQPPLDSSFSAPPSYPGTATFDWIPNRLIAVPLGPYRLAVTIKRPNVPDIECTVYVRIVALGPTFVPPARGGWPAGEELAWVRSEYLVRGMEETGGFGLYSYILFNARPNKYTKDRYVAVLQNFIRFIPYNVTDYVAKHELNAAYIPILKLPEHDKVLDYTDEGSTGNAPSTTKAVQRWRIV